MLKQVVDGFSYNTMLLWQYCRFFPNALAQLDVLRRAVNYRTRWWCIPDDFSVTLYDPNMHQLSNLPIPQGYFNAGKPTPGTQPPYQGCFPVPSIVYPAGSAITMDVTSLLCGTSVPQTYDVSFEGIWRLPC